MGFLIPDSEMTHDDLIALKNEIALELIRRAVAQTGRNASEFVVRDAFPKDDFGFNGVEWQNQSQLNAADTWESDWTKELPNDKFVAFYGVNYHQQATVPGAGIAEGFAFQGVSYRVGSGGATTREQVHLQSMQREFRATGAGGRGKNPVGYHKPVYYDSKETIYIALIGNAGVAQYAEQLELLCMVCEPWGATISGADEEVNPGVLSVSIPEDEITVEEIKALREEVKAKLIAMAVKETGKPASDFVVRDIFPKDDLDFNGVEWQNQTAITAADTWTKDWTKELPKTKFVAFFGVDYKKSATTFAAWKYMGVSYKVGANGASTRKQVHIQNAQRENMTLGATAADVDTEVKSARCYHRPVFYKGTETIYLSLIANATVTVYYDQIQLLGLICEPYGSVISGK